MRAEYQQTTSENTFPGGIATLTFSGMSLVVCLKKRASESSLDVTSGIQVAVYGTRPPGNYFTRSTYAIDGGDPTVFTAPAQSDSVQYGVQFYLSGPLSNAEHTLVITNYGYSFVLDYFDVTSKPTIFQSDARSFSAAKRSKILTRCLVHFNFGVLIDLGKCTFILSCKCAILPSS